MAFPKSTQVLLEKYWAAETTPEEEAQLRAIFENDNESVLAGYFKFLNSESARELQKPAAPLKQARKHLS